MEGRQDIFINKEILLNPSKSTVEKMNALFSLRDIKEGEVVETLMKAFKLEMEKDKEGIQPSDLLLHEICYAFGQIGTEPSLEPICQKYLEEIMRNHPSPIVVHEATEAYANLIGSLDKQLIEDLIKKFANNIVVKETCQLALSLLRWREETDNGKKEGLDFSKLKFNSADPAPPFAYMKDQYYRDLNYLKDVYLDSTSDLFQRYRSLFTLRDMMTKEAIEMICTPLTASFFAKDSALLKHEICFVIGQLSDKAKCAEKFLNYAMENPEEAPVVKHEAALALGEISKNRAILLLHSKDRRPIVAESCLVGLSFIDEYDKLSKN